VSPTGATVNGSNNTAAFPNDFDNGLIAMVSAFDVAWTILSTGGNGGPNLMNEISDEHRWRSAESLSLPFKRSVFRFIETRGASNSGHGTDTRLAGHSAVLYQKLPEDW
jgi:hypothetical protein